MKSKTKATLRKLGMILAVALLFSALAVPVWAEGEGDTPPNPDNTIAADPTADIVPLAGDQDPPSSTPPTSTDADPVVVSYHVTSSDVGSQIREGQKCDIEVKILDSRIAGKDAKPNVMLASSSSFTAADGFSQSAVQDGTSVTVQMNGLIYSGKDNKLVFNLSYGAISVSLKTIELSIVQCVPTPPAEEYPNGEPNTPSEGEMYVTGYIVLTDIGGTELQRIEANQKCTIIVSVADTRFKNFTSKDEVVKYVTDNNTNDHVANIKVTSTGSFASPSLGDIYATGEGFDNGVFRYAVVLHDITYLGGDNKLSLDIGYRQASLALASVSQAISQCADASAEGAKDSALVLTSASYGGGSIEAGKDFTLTVDVLAPEKYAGAENVKVIITPPEQFTSSSGSTMVYVGDLKPGASRQVTFQLNASATAQSGSYPINVNVTGTSMASGAAAPSDSMSVTVPITQPERFEISRTDLPEYLSMGEEGYASVSFVNKGKGTIYNVSAEIKGEGITTTEGNLYVGNVASGTESSADFTIQTSQSGTLSAVLTVTYEDEKGNVKELTKEFSMTVEEMNMGGGDMGFDPGFDPMPMPEEPQGMPVWGWILIGVGVLAVGGGAAFFIIKKKKAKKKAAQLTEDDDEDL